MSLYEEIKKEISKLVKNSDKQDVVWFKTGKGEYSEHDKFLGIRVPELRKIAKRFEDISISDVQKLLHSEYNDERFLALLFINNKYDKGGVVEREQLFDLYVKNTKFINNWNLVDVSAHYVVGRHIFDKKAPVTLLDKLAVSKDLWERRISIVSTWYLIRQGKVDVTLKISKKLLGDKEDLIHKAVGWMLREVGKKDISALKEFIVKNVNNMPRTTLRYAIERFPEKERLYYLNL